MGLRRKARERAVQALFQLESVGFPLATRASTPPPPTAPMATPAPEVRPTALLWTLLGAGGGPQAKIRRRATSTAPATAPPTPFVAPPALAPTLDDALEAFWASFVPQEPEARALADPLIRGVLEHRVELDRAVETCSLNWRVDRMARVDRNILRLGVYELLHRPEVPKKVCLNEAIEIARRFGSEESGAFINGVLDKVAQSARPGEVETDEGNEPPGIEP